jgi:NAD(P)-dependent dehydrogenase (short-subunit alcohol dehydrogenase family)
MGLLDDKIAIVTGAASGIGRAGAQLMAEAGASVVVADINETGGEVVASAIAEAGGAAPFHTLDGRAIQRLRR